MPNAPLPADESDRLRALRRLAVLDSAPEPAFDALVAAAALVCGVPVSLVSLVDSDRQWFKANQGLPGVTETPRDVAFCAHAILGDGLFEVPDASADPRFADNPLVTTAPHIRFYAGVPLRLSGGEQIGTLCVIDHVARQLTDPQRETLRLLAVAAVQALECRRMARASAIREARFRTLSDASPFGVFATDAGGQCVYTNERWRHIFALDEAEALGDGWGRTLYLDDKAAVFDEWQRTAALQQDFDMAFRVRHDDGTIRHVRAVAHAARDAEGAVTEFVGSVEDITDRLLAGRALDDERVRLAAIIEGTGVGTWEWNVQTGETRFNARWAEIVGVTLQELGPTSIQTWSDLAHPDDLAHSGELLQAHFAGHTSAYECEARMRHRDGHWVWVLDRGKVLTRTADGQPEWMFGTHLDITARKAQEARLRDSEALLKRTGALARVGGWTLDLATNDIVWTDETKRIHGVEPDEQPALDEAIHFYPEEARPVIESAVQQAIQTGQGWDLELPMVRRDGRRIWTRSMGEMAFEGGRPVRLIGAFQDITERKQLESELAAASARVLDLYENAPCGYHSLDIEGRFLHLNAAAADWFGCERDDLIGKRRPLEFFTPEGQEQFRRNFPRLLAEGRVEGLEFDLVPARGASRRVSLTATTVTGADGQFLMTRSAMFDISDLHHTREALRQRTAEQLAMVDHELIGIVRLRDRRAVWTNRALDRIFGYEEDGLLGQPARLLYPDDESYRALGDAAYPVLATGDTYRTQLQMRHKSGAAIWIDLCGMRMPTSPDETMWMMTDLTPVKRAEEMRLQTLRLEAENRHLVESGRLKSQFLANMSHELRTPLNAVIGFAHLLQSGAVKQESPKYSSYVTQIGASGKHLLQLIDTMLDYAKSESDRIEFHPQPVDLGSAINDVVDMLQPKCASRDITIQVSVADDARSMLIDPLRLRQILLNLIGNAVKFSHPGGRVDVRVQPDGTERVRVDIEDHGIGIADADLGRIFTPFRQLSDGTTKLHEGTGMGLALVHSLVASQGGRVGVRSTLGVGSTFHLTLPRVVSAMPTAPTLEGSR